MPLPGLVVTTLVSLWLLGENVRSYSSTGYLYNVVQNHRSPAQTVVQIISSVLGAAHLYVLTAMVNRWTRLNWMKGAISLDRLKFWNAVSSIVKDFSLPFRFLLPLLIITLAALIPQGLWSGALTPNFTNSTMISHIQVPQYGPDERGVFWNQTWDPTRSRGDTRNKLGTFSYSPAWDRGGVMLDAAAAASSRDTTPVTHIKNDNTRYSYLGRSYGVGASVGLVDVGDVDDITPLQTYSYRETGYQANVTCGKNDTSNWAIDVTQESDDSGTPSMYVANGTTPDNSFNAFAVVGLGDSSIVALVSHLSTDGGGIVAMATGNSQGDYTSLNNTQCNVTFTPTNFLVEVDAAQRVINVTALPGPAKDMDPTASDGVHFQDWRCIPRCGPFSNVGRPSLGAVATQVMRSIMSLSMIYTTLYTSPVGNMFLSNIASVQAAQANGSLFPGEDASMIGVARSLESLLDDALLAFSSAQIVVANETTQVDVSAEYAAIKIGQSTFIYLVTALNVFLVLVFLAEAIRTRFWRGLPLFDYRDLKSVIVASSMGGSSVARRAVARHGLTKSHGWTAEPTDAVVGRMTVILGRQARDDGGDDGDMGGAIAIIDAGANDDDEADGTHGDAAAMYQEREREMGAWKNQVQIGTRTKMWGGNSSTSTMPYQRVESTDEIPHVFISPEAQEHEHERGYGHES
ncbi:MAG: hypothetical protein M1838_000289 [Thelocarpon superellum]|nr:MAG: hypothetical protein M1838_000289 [Thelocarpon superellum]